MQNIGPHLRPTELETLRAGPQNLSFIKLKLILHTLKSEPLIRRAIGVPDQFDPGLLRQSQQNLPSGID